MAGITKKRADEKVKKFALECEYTYFNIKVYYEQIYRFYHGNTDIVSDYLQKAKSITDTLTGQAKVLSDEKRRELKKQRDSIFDEKDAVLKKVCADEGLFEQFFDRVKSIDSDLYFVAAIIHDKDVFVEDFWTVEPETDHIHIVFAGTLYPSGQRRRVKVADALEMLGIRFDKEADMSMCDNHAVEVCKDLTTSVKYLTHETPNSIADGKYSYDREAVVTNNRAMYDSMMHEIKATSEKFKLTAEQAVAYAPSFRASGKKLLSFREAFKEAGFSDWMWDLLPSKHSVSSVLEHAYKEGVQAAIGTEVDRICIYIYGCAEIGKTTAVEKLCNVLGIDRSQIFSCVEGTGKYDDLTPQHEVLLADDVSLSSILKIADDRVCQLNQRCKGKSVWAGHFVIATSNTTPEDMFHKWVTDSHGKVLKDKNDNPLISDKWEGRTSRFAFVHADEDGNLTLTKPYRRGTRSDKAIERNNLIRSMIEAMQESTREYCQNDSLTDSELLHYDNREVALYCRDCGFDECSYIIEHRGEYDNLASYVEGATIFLHFTIPHSFYDDCYQLVTDDGLDATDLLYNEMFFTTLVSSEDKY